MNDSRCLLQEFYTLVREYSARLPMTAMYRDSLIRRIEAELQEPRTEERDKAFVAWMQKEIPITFSSLRRQFDEAPRSPQREKT